MRSIVEWGSFVSFKTVAEVEEAELLLASLRDKMTDLGGAYLETPK